MATKTTKPAKTTQEPRPTPPAAEAAGVTDQDHQAAIDILRGRCLEMSFTVHGLPKNRRISGAMADQLAQSVGGRRKGVRASWSMFTSDHPQVKALNAAIRDLEMLRESWTIVKSAEVKKGDGDQVSIAGGKRLIWDKDVEEFYRLFTTAAQRIDAEVVKLQHAMDHTTRDADDEPVKSVKDMDRENAGDAWDEAAYPRDLTLTCGVSKQRGPDGKAILDEAGQPKYVINFDEYHVSEKLPKLLQQRAVERLDQTLSGTIETAVSYAADELTGNMLTFLGELANRVKLDPIPGEYSYLVAHGDAEAVKIVTAREDAKVPEGHTKALVRYKAKEDGEEVTVSKWVGPLRTTAFHDTLRPTTTGERKKIYPSVIEGIIVQLQAFKDRQARMLGAYGANMVSAFEPLLAALTKAKTANPLLSNDAAAGKLAAALKTSEDARSALARQVADAVGALGEQVTVVKEVARRRTIKMSLVGRMDD